MSDVDARDVKNVVENIDVVLSAMNGREMVTREEESENLEWLAELLKSLTGIDSNGHHNPDVAQVGRVAALRWLRGVGYVE